jgi:hypothetical protein
MWVPTQLRAVRHHLARMLLDLQALEAEKDDEQIRVQRRGRDRDHLALEGVAKRPRFSAEAVAHELVVHGLSR